MQNLSQRELDQITKMWNLLQNELEQIAKMRRLKNYKNMSVEGLLIALLKVEQRKKSEKISRKTRKKYQKEQENKQRAKELKNIDLKKKLNIF